MKGCGGGGPRRASAMVWAFVVAFCLAAPKTVSADEQLRPSAPAQADAQISSLLTKIEGAIAQGHAVPPEAGHMLISAGDLWSSASPEGRSLLKNFPARLRKNGDEVRDPETRKYLTVFADAAAGYIETMTLVGADRSRAPEPPAPAKQEIKAVKAIPPPPSDPPKVQSLPFPIQRTLLDRGDAMLDLGDVSAARLLYQRAADADVGVAAFKLAQTYDPAFLTARNLRGIRPDPTAAEAWYRKAEALGEASASERLKSLTASRLAGEMTTR